MLFHSATILTLALCSQVPAFDDPQSLAYAARKGNADRVKELVATNEELVDTVDEHRRTPFLYAAKAGHVPVLEVLFKFNPKHVEQLDEYGYAPVHWAVMYAKIPVLKFYHDHELPLKTLDKQGQNGLHLAMGNPFSNTHQKHAEVVKLLLKYGLDPNLRDPHGNTPLHTAAGLVGQLDAAKAIVEQGKGVDLNAQDEHGDTPLHRAAAFANVAVVRYLLNQSADRNVQNKDGRTPLDVARNANLTRSPEVVALLSAPEVQ